MTHGVVRSLAPHLLRGGDQVASAVYGTVTTVAVIVVAGHESTTADQVLVLAGVSSLVVWVIHVYATVLSEICMHQAPWQGAVRRGFREEVGVLEGAAAPLAVLVLGTLGVVDPENAVWWSVLVGVAMLTVMPLFWLRRSGQPWGRCLAASAVACSIGLALVVLKVLAH